MYCKHCGNQIEDGSQVCAVCGGECGQNNSNITQSNSLWTKIFGKEKIVGIGLVLSACSVVGALGLGLSLILSDSVLFMLPFMIIGFVALMPALVISIINLIKGILKFKKETTRPEGFIRRIIAFCLSVIFPITIIISMIPESTIHKAEKLANEGKYTEAISLLEQDDSEKSKEMQEIYTNIRELNSSIESFGEITASSGKKIEEMETKLNNIPKKYRNKVTDKEKIAQFRNEYNAIVQKAAKSVSDLIDKIEKAAEPSQEEIKAAKEAYNDLDTEGKKLVENYDALVKKAAQIVVDAIAKIEKATNPSQTDIDAAKKAYDDLDDESKKLVGNYDALAKAEEKVKQKVKADAEKMVNENIGKFNVEHDNVENYTWYQHKNQPKYVNTKSYLIPYIGKNASGNYWICIRYNYTGDDWIFWEDLIISVRDGNNYKKSVSYSDIHRDNARGDVWENYDQVLSIGAGLENADILMLLDIVGSKNTIVRFKGDDGYRDVTLTAKDKEIIKDVLNLYMGFVYSK